MKHNNSYEELALLVSAYQDGSTDAAEKIVANYDGYFLKFMSVMHPVRFRMKDRTQRNFLKLFCADESARKNSHLYAINEVIYRKLMETLSNVREMFRHYHEDELMSEMVILLLEMARTHNGEAPFHIYVSQYFPRKLYKRMRAMVQGDVKPREVYYDDEDIRVAHYDDEYDDEKPKYYIEPTTPTDFDENWVNGYGCGEVFEDLTIYERRLMKWYYEAKALHPQAMDKDIYESRKALYKCTETDIAYRLGCNRKTVNLKRNDAKRRVEVYATDLHLLKGSQPEPHKE